MYVLFGNTPPPCDLSMGARIRGDSVPVRRSSTDARVWEYRDDYYLVSAGDPPRLLPLRVAVHSIMMLSGTTPSVTAPQFCIACSTLAIAARKRLVLNSVSSWLREM